jgi:hypothetical protein
VSITINKFSVLCRVPPGRRALADIADRLARNRLGREFSLLLGPALSRQAPVVRIRRLNVKVALSVRGLTEEAFALAWARALAHRLFEALGRAANGSTEDVASYDSILQFHSAFLAELLAGRARGMWQYAEFSSLIDQPPAEAAMTLLLQNTSQLLPLLEAININGSIDLLLAQLNELSLERLFIELARASPSPSRTTLAPADLLWAATHCLATSHVQRFPLDGRRYAMRMFLRTAGGHGRSPRVVFHALIALVCLLECPDLLWNQGKRYPSPQAIQQRVGRQLPPVVSSLLVDLQHTVHHHASNGSQFAAQELSSAGEPSALLSRLRAALEPLRPLVPTAAAAADLQQPPWFEMECASLFLLASSVIRLGWGRLDEEPLLRSWGGERILHYLLAQIGAVICHDRFDPQGLLDPAVALFAGIEAQPDLAGMRHFLQAATDADRRLLLDRMIPTKSPDAARPTDALAPDPAPENPSANPAATWQTTFDLLATRLVLTFGQQVRGFRNAGRAAIARQFLRAPGRVRTAESEISVMLSPHPLHVALHVSGMNAPVPWLPWIGGRRLEFILLEN